MTDPGYYDQSYPPSLWAPPPAPVGAAVRAPAASEAGASQARQAGDTGGGYAAPLSQGLTATAGTPGAYAPPLRPAERPRNITELRERVTVADVAPWPRDAYLVIGESGRRAHWTGTEWKGGESPGYPGESERRTTMPEDQPPGVSE